VITVFGSEGVEMAGNTTTRRHPHVSNNNRRLPTITPSILVESEMFFDTRIYWLINHRWLVRFIVK